MRWPILLTVLLVSCSSTSGRVHFEPNPLEFTLREPWNLGRALLSVVSLKTNELTDTYELEIRMRAENQGNWPFRIQTRTMTLLTADLKAFGPPRAEPSPDPLIPPGEQSTVSLFFPVPAETDELNIDSLNLRWTLEVSGFEISNSANFERKREYYYQPVHVYPYYPYYPYWY